MGKSLKVLNHVLKNGYEYETSPFGPRKDPFTGNNSYHNGEDMISSKFGTDYIIAYQDGTVEALRNTIAGMDKVNSSGNYIYIKHAGGYQTRYLHLKKDSLVVKVGQAVKKGEVIAFMGTTGYSTGNHLHFEVRLNNTPQNPVLYLSGDKDIPCPPTEPTPPANTQHSIGDTVDFKGGYHYSNAQADKPSGGRRTAGKAKITGVAHGKRHPYHLIGLEGGSNVYGWVDENTIEVPTSAPQPAAPQSTTFKQGDRVKISAQAKWYSGKSIPAWVKGDTWIVYQDQIGDRVVLDSNVSKRNNIMSAIKATDLSRV